MPARAALILIAIIQVGAAAGQIPRATDEAEGVARAEQLLARARQAVGGEDALKQVTTLSAALRLRRFVEYIAVTSPSNAVRREKVLKGRITVELQPPDRFRKRVSTSTFSGYQYSYQETVNGDLAWRDPPLRAASSNPKGHVIDVSDFERSLAFQAQGARQQLSFFALAMLIRTAPGAQLRFSSAGWMRTESGIADVISVQGPDDTHMRLLLDQNSHLLAAFDSSFNAVRRFPVVVEGSSFTRAGQTALMQKARQERLAQAGPPQLSRIEIRFSDYRRVGGILLPHNISTFVGGKLAEELIVVDYRLNPRFNPKIFGPKPSKK